MAASFCKGFITDYTVDTDINILWNIFRDFCMRTGHFIIVLRRNVNVSPEKPFTVCIRIG